MMCNATALQSPTPAPNGSAAGGAASSAQGVPALALPGQPQPKQESPKIGFPGRRPSDARLKSVARVPLRQSATWLALPAKAGGGGDGSESMRTPRGRRSPYAWNQSSGQWIIEPHDKPAAGAAANLTREQLQSPDYWPFCEPSSGDYSDFDMIADAVVQKYYSPRDPPCQGTETDVSLLLYLVSRS